MMSNKKRRNEKLKEEKDIKLSMGGEGQFCPTNTFSNFSPFLGD